MPSPAPPGRAVSPDAPRHGGGRWWLVCLLPVLVVLPLINYPLRADHRFNPFLYGGDLTQRPWEVVTGPLNSIPNYFEHGNFRPLGRMVEQGQDLMAFSLSRAFDVPMPIALRVVSMIFIAFLCVATVWWAETVSSTTPLPHREPSVVGVLTALAVPTFLVGTTSSAVVLFTSLYFCSAALVLLFATAAARLDWLRSRHAGVGALAAAAVAGAAGAAFNEITYLAVPLAVVTVGARGLLTLRMPPADLVQSAAARLLLAATIGFAAVVVPVRFLIAQHCADGGCYSASSLSLTDEVPLALAHRLGSTLPGQSWLAAGATPADWLPRANPAHLLILLVVLAIATALWRRARSAPLPDPWALGALLVAGLLLLLGASLAMALTAEIQERVSTDRMTLGRGWRDLGLVAAGGALVVAAVGALLLRWGTRRGRRAAVTTGVVGVLTVTAMITLNVNATVAADQRPDPGVELFDRISIALMHHGPDGEEGCAMLEEFAELHSDGSAQQGRLERALDSASQAWHGVPFCDTTTGR